VFAQLVGLILSVLIDEHAPHADIVKTIEHQCLGWRAISPGAADFLVIGFDAGRQIEMTDKADVGLVNAHAERNRRHHDHRAFAHEAILVEFACFRLLSRVIGDRQMTGIVEKVGDLLGIFP